MFGNARQFLVEEQRRLGRLLLPVLDVLVQVQRGQLVGDLLRVGRHLAVVRQAEGDRRLHRRAAAPVGHLGADRRQLDVAPHAVEDVLAGLLLARVAVEPVLVDQVEQRRARHHLLADHLDAFVGEAGDGRTHEFLRNFLLLDQDRRGRAVHRWQRHRDHGRDDEQHSKHQADQPATPPQDAQVVTQGLARIESGIAAGVKVLCNG